ncbi:translin-like [Mercenaria mercenaria]|uniref:translin-like n=1 Tax=Mercenaria mercenaria TaxID=6596 RepID=UPI001E1DE80E|nr:translin-like [Mercenaria mercenaria]
MTTENNITQIFSDFQQYLENEQQLREDIRSVVRDVEQTAREILTQLHSVHQPDGIKSVSIFCEKCVPMFETIRQNMGVLGAKVPANQYYRYNDQWRFVIQRLAFLSAYLTYLQSETLVTRETVAQMIGVKVDRQQGFHLDLDDYLMGLLQLASELSRLAVNSVTAGDYGRPMRIAKFVGELDSGFRLLNLKNDSLRKRFDGLKYDLKKVEEVVYDLTIRGLKPAE